MRGEVAQYYNIVEALAFYKECLQEHPLIHRFFFKVKMSQIVIFIRNSNKDGVGVTNFVSEIQRAEKYETSNLSRQSIDKKTK